MYNRKYVWPQIDVCRIRPACDANIVFLAGCNSIANAEFFDAGRVKKEKISFLNECYLL